MMVTTRLGYGCAAADAADARRPKNASTTPKTRRIEFPFQLNEERSLRPRDHGQQEIRHRARAEVERIAAVEHRGWAVVRIGVRERADASSDRAHWQARHRCRHIHSPCRGR